MKATTVLLASLASAFSLAAPKYQENIRTVNEDVSVKVLVYPTMFENSDWSGASITIGINTQTTCFGLDGSGWSNRISSIIVPSGYRCRFWDSNSCNGDSSPDIYAPGATELGSMNDKATSFKCYQN